GKTVEIGDPARAFGGTYGITVRQTLALRLIAAAHPTLPPVELNRIPSPSFRAGAHFSYDYIINQQPLGEGRGEGLPEARVTSATPCSPGTPRRALTRSPPCSSR